MNRTLLNTDTYIYKRTYAAKIAKLANLRVIVTTPQGRPVASTNPNNDEFLKWNGTAWTPAAIAGGTGAELTAARSTLGLGSIATQAANSVNITGGTISGVTFSSRGISDGADATAITIDSSEKVGIGTSLPSERLDLGGGNIAMGYERIVTTCSNAAVCTAICTAGKQVTGGACANSGFWSIIYSSASSTTAYTCSSQAAATGAQYIQAIAYCANIK